MTEFKTVEGHPIKEGGLYEIRDGGKAFVSYIILNSDINGDQCGVAVEGCFGGASYYDYDGKHPGNNSKHKDLMRPWKEKEEEKPPETVKQFIEMMVRAEKAAIIRIDRKGHGTYWEGRLASFEVIKNSSEYEALKALVERKEDTSCQRKVDDSDGWIQWEGGNECPVDGNVIVQIKLRYNGIGGTRAAKKWAWGRCIEAYRIVEEPEEKEVVKDCRHKKVKDRGDGSSVVCINCDKTFSFEEWISGIIAKYSVPEKKRYYGRTIKSPSKTGKVSRAQVAKAVKALKKEGKIL